jgi:hypothetical protein
VQLLIMAATAHPPQMHAHAAHVLGLTPFHSNKQAITAYVKQHATLRYHTSVKASKSTP